MSSVSRFIPYGDPDVRNAFRDGARQMYESLVIDLEPRQERAVRQWLAELDSWIGGPPPPPPYLWKKSA